jgi:hypothetical protein
MTSEQKVRQVWPNATIEWNERANGGCWMVTLKPGRYCFGRQKTWAWRNAWDSITQDDELCHGAPPADRRDAPEPKAKGPNPQNFTPNTPKGTP